MWPHPAVTCTADESGNRPGEAGLSEAGGSRDVVIDPVLQLLQDMWPLGASGRPRGHGVSRKLGGHLVCSFSSCRTQFIFKWSDASSHWGIPRYGT